LRTVKGLEAGLMVDIETIIFDVDGTLVDSRKDIVKAVHHALRAVGLEEKSSDQIITTLGMDIEDFILKCIGRRHRNLLHDAVDSFTEYFLKHAADESKLYPHVKEVLRYFQYKRKFVVTNRKKNITKATLKKLGVMNYFEDIFGADDETCMKPSVCPIDRLSARHGFVKEKTMIVGDMDIDIMTGKNFGIKTCWVSYGLGKKEDVEGLRPDFTVDDIRELERIIR
jgi:phosphoglycolate phosphatase